MSTLRTLALAIIVTSACGPAGPAVLTPSPSPAAQPPASLAPSALALWEATLPPTGVAAAGAEWIAFRLEEGKKIPAALFRPEGRGPFPVVVVLHSDGGFRQREIDLAASFAKDGFVAIAACWFRPGPAQGAAAIACPDAPPWVGGYERSSVPVDEAPEARVISALLDGVRTLPGIYADRVALLGHSAGARAAVRLASTGGTPQAVVSIASPYGVRGRRAMPLTPLIDGLGSPLLIVHGTADVSINDARQYEALAREKGKEVPAIYVEGAPHDLPFDSFFWDPTRPQVVAFLKRHLAR